MSVERGSAVYGLHGLMDVIVNVPGVPVPEDGSTQLGLFSAKQNHAGSFRDMAGKLGTLVSVDVPIEWVIAVVKAAGYRVFKEV